MKTCRRCNNELSESEFKMMENGKLSPLCNNCIKNAKFAPTPTPPRSLPLHKKPRKKYGFSHKLNPRGMSEPYAPQRGLSIDEQNQLYQAQDERCAICGRKLYLRLDYDHTTGLARGYLCVGCNAKLTGIDNSDFLAKAQDYLKNPPAYRIKNT